MMAYLTDLADACRKSGLKVVEVDGWKTRGHGPMASVSSVMVHHTGTSDSSAGDIPTLRVLRDGYAGLKGPLSQLGLSRSGVVYVVAAGRCWHAGPVAQWWQQNSNSIGIEAEASGRGPIGGVQLAAYHRLVKALTEHYRIPNSRVISHGEAAVPRGRKTDILNNMTQFRRDVAAVDLGGAKAVAAIATQGASVVKTASTGGVALTTLAPGVPQPLVVDGALGRYTWAAVAWHIKAPAPTRAKWEDDRMFVRRLQTWVGDERTGIWTRQNTRSLQRKVSAVPDGIWGKNTTVGLQRFINKRIAEARAVVA